ncbi:MAG: DUF4154 domain-containing protein [Acidobacteria bacterium]|nr:DUF4154 domain-containing protein [Acidobacteriota bacterium]
MRSKYLAIVLVVFCLLLPSVAGDMPVPPELQVAIFKKVFNYDKSIQGGSPKMLVAFTDNSAAVKDQVVKAFKDSGVNVSAAKADQLSSSVAGVNVLYITPGVSGTKQICQKNGILSITGTPSLVESGDVSVGLSVQDNKPKIVVHLGQLKAEGHDISANLLQLAKIIQ